MARYGQKTPKKNKKKSRREKSKYSALDPKYNIKVRKELADYDYVPALKQQLKFVSEDKDLQSRKRKEAKDALDFLNNFHEGWANNDFRKDEVKEIFKDRDDIRLEAGRRNNYRNQDAFSITKANQMLRYGGNSQGKFGYDENNQEWNEKDQFHKSIDQVNNFYEDLDTKLQEEKKLRMKESVDLNSGSDKSGESGDPSGNAE